MRQFDRLPESLQLRVSERLTVITEQPTRGRVKKLQGYELVWSTRVGDYRIAYSVFEEEERLRIEAIGHRRDFYERLERLTHLR